MVNRDKRRWRELQSSTKDWIKPQRSMVREREGYKHTQMKNEKEKEIEERAREEKERKEMEMER